MALFHSNISAESSSYSSLILENLLNPRLLQRIQSFKVCFKIPKHTIASLQAPQKSPRDCLIFYLLNRGSNLRL